MLTWATTKNWLSDQSVPRWQLLTGATLVLAANFFISVWLQSVDHRASLELAEQQEVRDRMTEIRLTAVDFQTFAADYVSAVIAGNDLSVPEKALIENVMRQHSVVELSRSIYGRKTLDQAAEYQEALTAFNMIVPKSHDIVEMAPFWQAASRVLTARDAFLMSLQEQAKLSGT